MSERMDLVPFCECERGTLEGFPAERYRVGFRRADGAAAVEITLPAETVERVVLTGARFSLWMRWSPRIGQAVKLGST
jgi:hypothetical protein